MSDKSEESIDVVMLKIVASALFFMPAATIFFIVLFWKLLQVEATLVVCIARVISAGLLVRVIFSTRSLYYLYKSLNRMVNDKSDVKPR